MRWRCTRRTPPHPPLTQPDKPYLGRPYTGWPPGLLQDDCRALFDWFASRLDARERVRDVCGEQRVTHLLITTE